MVVGGVEGGFFWGGGGNALFLKSLLRNVKKIDDFLFFFCTLFLSSKENDKFGVRYGLPMILYYTTYPIFQGMLPLVDTKARVYRAGWHG